MPQDHPKDFDLSEFDSALADTVYSPEEVALLERVLEDVCRRAGTDVATNHGLRTLLAAAILEGALLGYRDHDRLAAFALRVLPPFRERGPV